MSVPTYVGSLTPPPTGPPCEWNRSLLWGARGPTGVYGTPPRYRPRTVLRPPRRAAPNANERRRSHAAVPVAIALVILGLALGTYTVAAPVLLGLLMLGVAVSFLSSRINPLSVGFYLNVKPSWTAIGVVALGALVLFAAAWWYWTRDVASILPGHGLWR